jgi:Kef-type K+ transport system membrane component KefB/mannitol/fructose-specific phosphotransferase system IIA component (Ntr-type)
LSFFTRWFEEGREPIGILPLHLLAAAALEPAEMTVVLLSLAVLLGLARLLGELAREIGQPAVLGEILAGIFLGPTVLGWVSPEIFATLFPEEGSVRIATEGFVLLSATLLLLVVGLDVDLSTVWRQGRAALSVSALGIALPFSLGFALAWTVPEILGIGSGAQPLAFALFVGIAMSITALPVIGKVLMDLNLARSDMGTLIISSAMLNDLVGWIGFAVVLALMPTFGAESEQPGVMLTIVATLLFLGGMLTVGRWLAGRALPFVQAHWSWPGGVLGFVLVVALLCAALTEYLGVHSIFGAFIAGVAIGDSPHLTQRTRDTIHQFITNIFAPIFFASIGLRINFIDQFDVAAVAIVFGVALTAKVIGCFLGARGVRMGPRESWAVGFGMAAQGTVGIILGQLARSAGLITDELMVAIVIMALGTSLISGPAMQKILRQRTKRRLVDLLSERQVMLSLKGRTVDEALRELTRRAADLTGIEHETVYDAVAQREQIMPTGMPGGLAVPHARLEAINKPWVIVSRSPAGIDFECPDRRPARLVFLLLTPVQQPESQIETLNLISRAFSDEAVCSEAMQVKTPTELLAVLNRRAPDTDEGASA